MRTPMANPTTECHCFRQAVKPLTRIYGSMPAREFDAAALDSVRRTMIDGSWRTDEERAILVKQNRPLGWSRGNCNKQVSRLRSVFRWAVLKKIVPASDVTDLV